MSFHSNHDLIKQAMEKLEGVRVEFVRSNKPDPQLTAGMRGTVQFVDDQPALVVLWDNGTHLSLLPGVDTWAVVEDES